MLDFFTYCRGVLYTDNTDNTVPFYYRKPKMKKPSEKNAVKSKTLPFLMIVHNCSIHIYDNQLSRNQPAMSHDDADLCMELSNL